MDWPAKSPDMNPIEHIWDLMAIHICDMDNPRTTQQQMTAWNTLRTKKRRSLARSMSRRLCAAQDARGGHTWY